MEKIVNLTDAKKNLLELIKEVNRDSKPILLSDTDDDKSAILMSKHYYDAQQEIMALILNGQLKNAIDRNDDKSVSLSQMMKDIDNE